MKNKSKALKILFGIMGVVLICVIAVLVYGFTQYAKYKDDLNRLKTESYDTVFFAMYPTDNYVEEDWTYFRGMQVVKTDAVIPNMDVMRLYMDTANESGNVISTVYLGIDPATANQDEVIRMIQKNPDKLFEVILAYPEISYWISMEDAECHELIRKYYALAGSLVGLENANGYLFAGEEWLIGNPANYVDYLNTNTAVSRFLMCSSDVLHSYLLTAVNNETTFQKTWETISSYREESVSYADASDWDVIFLGDSIFGEYVDSMSIPGVVNGLTGANAYNLGYGGQSAALSQDKQTPVSEIVEALVTGDMKEIPQESQTYNGLTEYFAAGKHDNMLFVINYGLNDYFDGVPVKTEDPYDVRSYEGVLRKTIEMLQKNYPDARIILNTPNVTINFENGEGMQGEAGGKLIDYAEAVRALGEELQVMVLDNYAELPINLKVYWEYMADGVHLNEKGRFLVGKRIADLMQEVFKIENEK